MNPKVCVFYFENIFGAILDSRAAVTHFFENALKQAVIVQ